MAEQMRQLAMLMIGVIGCGTNTSISTRDDTVDSAAVKASANLFDKLLSDVAAAANASARQAKVDAFLSAVPQSPYVSGTTVVFLSIGAASISSDLNDWSATAKATAMTQVSDTSLWYRTFTGIPSDARCDYKLIINGVWQIDPRNPNQSPGISDNNSELWMPAYQPSAALAYSDVAHGDVVDVTSQVPTNDSHQLLVYFPPGHFAGSGPYDLLIVNDGGDYLSKGLMANVLDNLIAEGTIRPIVAVFVVPNDRDSEYFGDCTGSCPGTIQRYLTYLTADVVPFAEQNWKVSSDAAHHGIMGSSYGGAVSLRAAYNDASLFGLVAGQSARVDAPLNGEFSALATDYTKSVKPLKIYLDVGTINDLQSDDTAFDKSLKNAGYKALSFAAYHDGHAWGNWRNRIAALLTFLFPS